MRRQLTTLAAAIFGAMALALGVSGPARAVCLVTLVDDTGSLGLSADYRTLSSELSGGSIAEFTVLTALDSHAIVIDPPGGFVNPPAGGDADVTFTVTYALSGATVLGQALGGLNYPLGLGLTTVTVNAKAEKSSGVFPAGDYELELDARCI
jgi:hypothetical protein